MNGMDHRKAMSEDEVAEAAVDAEVSAAGLIFHEGTRLTDLKLSQNLSIDYPQLEPLHHVKIEFIFHFHKLRTLWTRGHWLTLGLGMLAVLLSGWDLGISELSSGGDYLAVGINIGDAESGLASVADAALALAVLTIALWIVVLARMWTHFPLMRSQAVSLVIALLAAQGSQYWAHAFDPRFPLGFDNFAVAVAGVGVIVIVFVCFIMQRAVIETRDLHVQEKHWHPDPRQMEIAMRDHSLIAWGVGLGLFAFFAIIHGWSGAHYVAIREPSEVAGWFVWKWVYLLSGFAVIWHMTITLWYPQMMLGTGDTVIESDRAREVTRESKRGRSGLTVSAAPTTQGACPDCGEASATRRMAGGEIECDCDIDGCGGAAAPGEKCSTCGERISSRIVCAGCGVSAPVSSHFSDEEAW